MGYKFALITGITGQDGSYLAELLLTKNYQIYGLVRRISIPNKSRIDHLLTNPNLHLLSGDVTDMSSIIKALNIILSFDPEVIEIYNLAAQSHVKTSFDNPISTTDINSLGPLNILESIRQLNIINKIRFYQASTSEMFGKVVEKPQTEQTPFYPRSPYGVSKLFAHWITKNYREAYGMYACSGILYNHESPRRGSEFVTRKITLGISNILKGNISYIELGNIDTLRDWGHAEDYVYGMWLMMQQEIPNDYIISTGEQHSVREFIEKAFHVVSINISWKGNGVHEEGHDSKTGKLLIKINPDFYRPTEVNDLLGDSSLINKNLSWKPKNNFDDLIRDMVMSDL